MLSLNEQAPMTPNALGGEYSIVMLYHTHCPTLRAIILRSVYWVRTETHQTYWYPQADDLQLRKMWEGVSETGLMSARMAEDVLHPPDGRIGDSSGEYVSMDLDSASEEASDYGDQSNVRHLLSAEAQSVERHD